MANYDKDTKFYWLQLKEDFFENDAIEWLEEQEPNGRDYAYFYLKLCLKSLKTNGILIRKVGNFLIPYDNQKLAELTKMDFDSVVVAMELLKKIGLVKILENGEIYINQLENLIGSKSLGAFKKQQQRSLKGGQGVDKCPPKIEIEIEKEIEIEIDKEVEEEKINNINNNILNIEKSDGLQKIIDFYNNNIGLITPYCVEVFQDYMNEMDYDVIIYAMKRAVEANIRTIQYIKGTLNNWRKKGIKTLLQVQEENYNFRKNKEPRKETEAEAMERKIKQLEEAMKNGD